MNKAKLTEDGARLLGRPDLAGKKVDYDGVKRSGTAVGADNLFCKGSRIGGTLSFTGPEPGLIDPTEMWRTL